MERVRTEQELKYAVKNKEDVIIIEDALAISMIKEFRDYEKQKKKGLINRISKGAAAFSFVFLPLAPIPLAIIGGGILGSILTKNELKKYEVVVVNEWIVRLTRK